MIELRDLSLGYSSPGNVPQIFEHSADYDSSEIVLKDLNLKFEPGKVYGLIGRNGAGKTTLLNCISGLIWKNAIKKVFIDGKPMSNGNPSILSKIFYVTDAAPLLHVRVNKYAKKLSLFYPDFSMECFNECVEMFQLNYGEYIDNLSLGQKKMAFLSYAFASNASHIILDEPTNGLDITSMRTLRKLIASNMTDDKTMIISTHHINEISSLLDHIIILNNKKVVFDHSVMETGRALSFVESDKETDNNNALYSMTSAYGNRIILPNTSGIDSEIDYELLFEAVLDDSSKIDTLF
jgi:ABC-2 type transport system ATP-binding protein